MNIRVLLRPLVGLAASISAVPAIAGYSHDFTLSVGLHKQVCGDLGDCHLGGALWPFVDESAYTLNGTFSPDSYAMTNVYQSTHGDVLRGTSSTVNFSISSASLGDLTVDFAGGGTLTDVYFATNGGGDGVHRFSFTYDTDLARGASSELDFISGLDLESILDNYRPIEEDGRTVSPLMTPVSEHGIAVNKNGMYLIINNDVVTAAGRPFAMYATPTLDSPGRTLDGGGSTAGPVPEPGTWALMIVGLGAVGGAMRRRRPVPRFA